MQGASPDSVNINITVLCYAAGALLFLILTVLLLTAWRGRLRGGLLVLASGITTLWLIGTSLYAANVLPLFSVVQLLEILRNASWFLLLLELVGFRRVHDRDATLYVVGGLILSACGALAVLVLANRYTTSLWELSLLPAKIAILGHLILSVCGLVLVEQLYRRTRPEHLWAVKFLCLGVGGMFAYDLFMYSEGLLLGHLNVDLWAARGVIYVIVVPTLALAAARNPEWSVDVFVSRHVVFHTAGLLGAGVYLLGMSAVGYYIKFYGGTWGSVVQAAFLFGSLLLLMTLMSSEQLRSRTRVFLSKHFFRNRYDYREEWLNFTRTLSTQDPELDMRTNILRAIAGIVESPGGVMWVRQTSGHFRAMSRWRVDVPDGSVVTSSSPWVRFLEGRGWLVLLDDYRRGDQQYEDLEIPAWLLEMRRAWLILPLMHGDVLVAFVVFARSGTKPKLNWEDIDLLKTVGRQAGGYVALIRTTEALSEGRQFEAFNRLSAFVVHDLKNMVAQLGLVVSNAKRHRDTPGFVDDAIATVDHTAKKMNRLLAQLRKTNPEPATERVIGLDEVLGEVVKARASTQPVPALTLDDSGLRVNAEGARLAAVIEHLVQNAQEATPRTGEVHLRVRREDSWAVVEIQDTGSGMDESFIAHRLFRPFDTTKGNAGMGIGVYESREFVTELGGEVEVRSELGAGTTFRLQLPLAATDQTGGPLEASENGRELAS